MKLVLACIAAAILVFGRTQEPDPSTQAWGDWGDTQLDIHQRASAEARMADDEYEQLRREIQAFLDDDVKPTLDEADRAFAAYRDAETALLTHGVKGGTLEPAEACGVRADLTRRRTQRLKEALRDGRND